MTKFELLVHRFCQAKFTSRSKRKRLRKGVRRKSIRKYQDVKYLSKELGVQIS